MSLLDSTKAARVLSIAIAGATILACGRIAGTDDAPVVDEGTGPAPNDTPTAIGGPDQKTDSNIVIGGDLDFGELPCGSESASARLISIQNKAASATTYKLVMPANTPFRIAGPIEGSVPAAGVTTIEVYAKAVVNVEATTDIVVAAGAAVQTVKPKVRGAGASLAFLPNVVSFGDVRKQNGGGPIPVDISNEGNAPVAITSFTPSSDFTLEAPPPTSLNIPPKGKVTLQAKLAAGMESGPLQVAIKPIVTQPLCGVPAELSVKGKRVTSDIIVSSADWGKPRCDAQATVKTITITNYMPTQLQYDVSLEANPSPFVIVSGAGSGSLGPGVPTPTTASVTVRPNPYGGKVGAITDNLVVNVTNVPDANGGGKRKGALAVDVRGAVIVVNPTTLALTSNGTNTDSKTFTATNTGNEFIYLDWLIDKSNTGFSGATPAMLGGAQMANGRIDFRAPGGPGTITARITATRRSIPFVDTGVLCGAPATIDLTGTKP